MSCQGRARGGIDACGCGCGIKAGWRQLVAAGWLCLRPHFRSDVEGGCTSKGSTRSRTWSRALTALAFLPNQLNLVLLTSRSLARPYCVTMSIVLPDWVAHISTDADDKDKKKPTTIFSLCVSPDGSRLATGGIDQKVRIWATEPILDPEVEKIQGAHRLLSTLSRHTGELAKRRCELD